jgi:tyrosinase
MVFTRKNVFELGADFADPILWYARGVKAMKARALSDPTAWRFFGAIHGFDQQLWTQLGFLSSDDQMPSNASIQTSWLQCQHGSWYFLPWHRGYVLAFEAVVRDAVVKLGGPADWALPYWNYFKPNQNQLPPAFASPDWPDGQGDNPLFVAQRFGPNNDGNVFIPDGSGRAECARRFPVRWRSRWRCPRIWRRQHRLQPRRQHSWRHRNPAA